MKFDKFLVSGLFVLFVFTGVVMALEVKKTEIILYTRPYQNLTLEIVDPNTNEILQDFTNRSRKFGEFRRAYYSLIDSILIRVKDLDTAGSAAKTYGPFSTGAVVEINITSDELPSGVIPFSGNSTNSTSINNTAGNPTNSSNGSFGNNPITGFTTGGEWTLSKNYYFVGLGMIVLGLAVFLLRMKMKQRMISDNLPSPEKVHKASIQVRPTQERIQRVSPRPVSATQRSADSHYAVRPVSKQVNRPFASKQVNTKNSNFNRAVLSETMTSAAGQSSEIEESERRIADLQKQIDQLRNKERAIQLQQRIAKEQEELRRMQEEIGKSDRKKI